MQTEHHVCMQMLKANLPLATKTVTKRKLAAIMFADMAGYTAMMQKDEESAIERWKRHREIMTYTTAQWNGEILQFYGDGTLSIFDSCIDAVHCAIEIQKACMQDPSIPLRIGIHSGDILLNDEGIFGDGVNVASRIESISVPGAILVSDKVYDEIRNHKALKVQKLGNFELKNVDQEVSVYAVRNEGIYVPDTREVRGKARLSSKSIIVLPFLNLTSEQDNEFFSDGMTEEILNALTKVDGLKVMSRTSSYAYKDRPVDVKQLASELQVDTVLEGSIRKSGQKVRITAQLINAEDDFHFWSETFDHELDDIFRIQDEIALKIANRLRAQFDQSRKSSKSEDLKPQNLDAYQSYLKARHAWNMYTPQGALDAVEHYKRALSLEPNYFLAFIGLTEAYCFLGVIGYIRPLDALKYCKEAMDKAFRLKPDHYKTYHGIASYKFFFEWDWKGAARYFTEALRENSDDPGVLYVYSLYLIAHKRFEEAIDCLKRAIDSDPLNLPMRLILADAYLYQGDDKASSAILDTLMETLPEARSVINTKAWHCFITGRQTEALKYFEQYQKMTNDPLKGLVGLGYAYARTLQVEKARECLRKLEAREERGDNVLLHMDFAIVYLGLKEYDKMFERLELAFGERLGGMAMLDISPIWDEIRRFPQYDSLMERIGKKL